MAKVDRWASVSAVQSMRRLFETSRDGFGRVVEQADIANRTTVHPNIIEYTYVVRKNWLKRIVAMMIWPMELRERF
ncbi:MAG: hypothetical protein ACRCY3_01750 [Sphingorhabdus sp.]